MLSSNTLVKKKNNNNASNETCVNAEAAVIVGANVAQLPGYSISPGTGLVAFKLSPVLKMTCLV